MTSIRKTKKWYKSPSRKVFKIKKRLETINKKPELAYIYSAPSYFQ